MTVNMLRVLNPFSPSDGKKMRILPSPRRQQQQPVNRLTAFANTVTVAEPDTFVRTTRSTEEGQPSEPSTNNKVAEPESYTQLGNALDDIQSHLDNTSDPNDKSSFYFTHAPSVGEKRKRMFVYTNGSQPLSIKDGAIEDALSKAGLLISGHHIQKLTYSTGYQESKASWLSGTRQMGGFGPFHILFRHGEPLFEDDGYNDTLRPEYREQVSRFFDSKSNRFATPHQIGQWIGETLSKGHVTGVESSEWDPQMKLITLTHQFKQGVGRRVESERGQLRFQRGWQGPINFNNVRVVVGYHPKHPNELYLYTAYPTP